MKKNIFIGLFITVCLLGCKHPQGLEDFNANSGENSSGVKINMSLTGTVMTFSWKKEDFKFEKIRFLREKDPSKMDAYRSSFAYSDVDVAKEVFSVDLHETCVITSFEPMYFGCWNYNSKTGKGKLYNTIGEPLVIENPAKNLSVEVNEGDVTFSWKDTTSIWGFGTVLSLDWALSRDGPFFSLGAHEIKNESYTRHFVNDLRYNGVYSSTDVFFSAATDGENYVLETPFYISMDD